jgi:hypothetical protein
MPPVKCTSRDCPTVILYHAVPIKEQGWQGKKCGDVRGQRRGFEQKKRVWVIGLRFAVLLCKS